MKYIFRFFLVKFIHIGCINSNNITQCLTYQETTQWSPIPSFLGYNSLLPVGHCNTELKPPCQYWCSKRASVSLRHNNTISDFVLLLILEDTARYTSLLLAPAEGFGLPTMAFFVLRAKKDLLCFFLIILGNFGVQ